MRPLGGSDQSGGGGADVALVPVPDRERDPDDELVVILLGDDLLLLEHPGLHLDVRYGRDLGQFETVAGPVQGGAGGEDVGVVAKDVGEDRVVVIVWDEAIDLPFDHAQRQLLQAHVGDELFPGVYVIENGLLVCEANDERLGPQCRRLVAGGETACQEVGLQPVDFVGEGVGSRKVLGRDRLSLCSTIGL
jgi:hypothetical protein